MKIDRLIRIVMTLQREGRVTAPYLADKFGVSRRTVNRDIEDICRAGIPVITTQGVGGGIEMMKGLGPDSAVYTEEELQTMFAALIPQDTPAKPAQGPSSAEKASSCGGVIIDIPQGVKDSLPEKAELVKKAAAERRRVKFILCRDESRENVIFEPAAAVFTQTGWHVYGYSVSRGEIGFYSLNMIWDISLTDEKFIPLKLPDKFPAEEAPSEELIVTAVYDKTEKLRLIEEYGPQSFIVMSDGKLFSKLGFSSYESALRWFLSFGEKVKIIAPADFLKKFMVEVGKILVRYK